MGIGLVTELRAQMLYGRSSGAATPEWGHQENQSSSNVPVDCLQFPSYVRSTVLYLQYYWLLDDWLGVEGRGKVLD